MKEIVNAINTEIIGHEASIKKLKRARSIIEDTVSSIIPGEPPLSLLPSKRTKKPKQHRGNGPVMRESVMKVLGSNGSMSVRNIVEAMRIDGYQFYRGTNRYSTVGSCLRRMERNKQIGVIKTGNAIVYTNKAEVLHPAAQK